MVRALDFICIDENDLFQNKGVHFCLQPIWNDMVDSCYRLNGYNKWFHTQNGENINNTDEQLLKLKKYGNSGFQN